MLTSSSSKLCANCHRPFHVYAEDRIFLQQFKFPDPTQCPECRLQRRLAFHPEERQSLVDSWFADVQTYRAMVTGSPHVRAMQIERSTECFGNFIEDSERCYLCVMAQRSRDVRYGMWLRDVKNAQDVTYIDQGENLYEVVGGTGPLKNVFFSANMTNCHDCFGCTNLTGASYCYLNESHTPDEYKALVSKHERFDEFFPAVMSSYDHHPELKFVNDHRRVYDTRCADCNADIHTAFLPSEFPQVLCEPCYLKAIL